MSNTLKSYTSKKERKQSKNIDENSMIITNMREMGLTPPSSPALITPTPVKSSCGGGIELSMENPISTPSPFRRRLNTADTPLIHNLPEGTPHRNHNMLESRVCSEDDDHCSLVSSLSNDDSLRMKAQAEASAALANQVQVDSPPPQEVHVTIPESRMKTPSATIVRSEEQRDREVHIPEWLEVELVEERDNDRPCKTPLVMRTRTTSVQANLPPRMSPSALSGIMNMGSAVKVGDGVGCLPPPPPRVKVASSPHIPRPSFGRSRTCPSMEFGSIHGASTSITAGSSFSNSKASAFDNISQSTPESRRESQHGSFCSYNMDGEELPDLLLGRRRHRRTLSGASTSSMTGPSIITGGSLVSNSPRSQLSHTMANSDRRKKNVVKGEIKYVLGRMSAPLKKFPLVRGKSGDIDLKRAKGCLT